MTARQGADPRDRLTRLAEALTREDWAGGRTSTWTPSPTSPPGAGGALRPLLGKANSVTVALTCDKLEEDEGARDFSPRPPHRPPAPPAGPGAGRSPGN